MSQHNYPWPPKSQLKNPHYFTIYLDHELSHYKIKAVRTDTSVYSVDISLRSYPEISNHYDGLTSINAKSKEYILSLNKPYHFNDVVYWDAASKTFQIETSELLKNDLDIHGYPLNVKRVFNPIGCSVKMISPEIIEVRPFPSSNSFRSFSYSVANQYMENGSDIKVYITDPSLPNDVNMFDQWFLHEMSLLKAWKDYSGAGANIGLIDMGLMLEHPEIASLESTPVSLKEIIYTHENLPTHPIMVSSIITAPHNNSFGFLGIAPSAKVKFHHHCSNVFPKKGSAFEDIFSCSFGLANKQDLKRIFPDINDPDYIDNALSYGRGGLGSIFIFGAGNENMSGSINYLPNAGIIFVGAYQGSKKNYEYYEYIIKDFSSPGPWVLISAPGFNIPVADCYDITVTSQYSLSCLNSIVNSDGTSFATPIVSGITALMLEANPKLGYRDVIKILSYSALFPELETSQEAYINNNYAVNGQGAIFNYSFGFGIPNALTAVRLAEVWPSTSTYSNMIKYAPERFLIDYSSKSTSPSKPLVLTTYVTEDGFIEDLLLTIEVHIINATLKNIGIILVSPMGTTISVFDNEWLKVNSALTIGNEPQSTKTTDTTPKNDLIDITLNIKHLLGEKWKGLWQVQFHTTNECELLVNNIELEFYGSNETDNTLYVNPNLFKVSKPDSSDLATAIPTHIKTINTIAFHDPVEVSLQANIQSFISNGNQYFFTSDIDNVVSGDGNDIITGNARNNIITPGRGDDTILTHEGNDVIYYPSLKWSNLGTDIVNDFSFKEDKIRFKGINFEDLTITQKGGQTSVTSHLNPSWELILIPAGEKGAITANDFEFI